MPPSRRRLPLANQQDFDDARRGLVLSDPDVVVPGPPGTPPIWDTRKFGFVEGDAPDSVNPSLWRQAKLNGIHGLFEVVEGVYQVRGYDLANMTVIRGDTGLILVDPLTAKETAAAALALARRHLGDVPIVAVIFTHSHVDHFGGVAGVLPDAASQQGVRIIAPADFVDEATSENVLAGIAMGRRATFMYGMPLARSPRGHVDTGLGKEPARGTIGILEPTEQITETGQELVIDGVRFVFQFAPHSEAPTELTFYLPDKKAWCAAEIVTHNLHNIYTLRGAKARDALLWSNYIDEALQRFGDAEVVFASHHWPVFGNARARDLLTKQRDLYKFLNDQTLRLANLGLGPQEIAETLELPASLRDVFPNRDYYGTVRHDAKGIYQFYFGWYDGNPANLDPLPPVEASQRYVEAMGGAPEALRKGREAAERGDYRWAATLLNHVVFAQPENDQARATLAGVYDQLGYRAESGPWRDVYLTGALELRRGIQGGGPDLAAAAGLLGHLPAGRFFDSLATRRRPEQDRRQTEHRQLRLYRRRRNPRRDARELGVAPLATRRRSERRRHGDTDARLPGETRDGPGRPARDDLLGRSVRGRQSAGAALVLLELRPQCGWALSDRDAVRTGLQGEAVSTSPARWVRRVLVAVALPFFASAAGAGQDPCATPRADADWSVATPEASGFDAAALCAEFASIAAGTANVHGVVVERHGLLVAELYRAGADRPIDDFYGLGHPFAADVVFGPDVLHDVRSISKSVVGLLFGVLATEDGAPPPSTPVLSLYPELADLRSDGRESITFEHLLTMSSGLAWREWGRGPLTSDETRLFWKADLVRFVFDRRLDTAPGAQFNYDSGGTATLADAITRTSGRPWLELARERLFEPLGITQWEWATDLRGRPLAFAGLRLRPRDLLKFGRLGLDRGRWRGRPVVPEAWIAESLGSHIATGVGSMGVGSGETGYGQQWWTGSVDWHGRSLAWSAGIGNGGQRLYVVPELDLAVAITAGDYGSMPIGAVVGRIFSSIVASVNPD